MRGDRSTTLGSLRQCSWANLALSPSLGYMMDRWLYDGPYDTFHFQEFEHENPLSDRPRFCTARKSSEREPGGLRTQSGVEHSR